MFVNVLAASPYSQCEFGERPFGCRRIADQSGAAAEEVSKSVNKLRRAMVEARLAMQIRE
jgi:hypothetical protein